MANGPRDRGSDHYRPHYARDDGPPPPPSGMFHFRGAAGGQRRRDDDRSDFTFRTKSKISERPLLRNRRGSKEGDEELLNNSHAQDRFRKLDELTDSDEAEMEDSEDEDGRPSTKRVRLDEPIEKPQWSNPDVYTSLPAPSETTGKKVDFVKLIRKARNLSTKSSDLLGNDEDFISFNDFDDDVDAPPVDAPTGPRARDTDRALGKRKRGEASGSKLIAKRGGRFYEDGMVLDEWRVKEGVHPTPWIQLHPDDPAGLALHKEILDFYDWVKPRDYEFEVRAGVISRLSAALNRVEPGELKAFGSYAAGLYLPTGDMDLVYLTRGFNRRRGFSNGIGAQQFHRYADFVRRCGVAQPDSITRIPKAKVPIIKYIDKISGLKVDLSFNNDTGVVAVDTFQKWKEQYPAMPILVSVIKQFLMIRGLNDVAVGGLGGFSIICLVTSILQHMPLSNSSPNLGEVLVEFLNMYGNLFDRDAVAVRLDPPGYVDKRSYAPYLTTQDKASRLTIIDPNRWDNNISGGTKEIATIFTCFSRAHDVLQNRLIDHKDYDPFHGQGFSFLEDLVGGNFGAYQVQRDILYGLHFGLSGPAPAIIPPPPPPFSREPLPPPPAPPTTTSAVSSKPAGKRKKTAQAGQGNSSRDEDTDDAPTSAKPRSKRPSKSERRATRLKTLRPELAPFAGSMISVQDAVQLGRYRDYNEMDKDLTRRELEMNGNGEA